MSRHQLIFIVWTTACSGAPTADSAAPVDAWWDIDGDQLSDTHLSSDAKHKRTASRSQW